MTKTIEEKIQKMAEEYADAHAIDVYGGYNLVLKPYITAAREFYRMGWEDGVDDLRMYMNTQLSGMRVSPLKCPLEGDK